ncbi:MAG TPA: ELWxxDGT repeat protein [Candidatus Margulisiibacteriota bacterium]|nr:ELWxxDGT repeat protein [Candidatus Margulisiibacteriota bacterium]
MNNTLFRHVLRKLACVTVAVACIATARATLGQTPYMVKDINPGSASSASAFVNLFANVGGTAFFGACDGSHGTELWKSDGTAKGTVLVKDLHPAGTSCDSFDDAFLPGAFGGLNGKLLLRPNLTLPQIWRSDGTAAGTQEFATGVSDVYKAGSALAYFWDGSHPTYTLYRTDATLAGTVAVSTWEQPYFPPPNLAGINGRLLIPSGGSSNVGPCLLSSTPDGTLSDLSLLASFNCTFTGVRLGGVLNGEYVFTIDEAALWKTDGTPGGTLPVQDPAPGAVAFPFTDVNGTLFFWRIATVPPFLVEYQLWKSNGTPAGTVKVIGAILGSSSGPQTSNGEQVNVNGTLVFPANDSADGTNGELWRSDGTAGGTFKVKDINPTSGSEPRNLTVLGGMAYFTADDGSTGRELWRSDGTSAGTQRVADINPGPNGSEPSGLTPINGTLYFFATDGVHGQELWALKASSPPKSKCASKKMTAIATRALDRAKCYSKASSKGAAVDATCLTKAASKFTTAVAKAETGTDCTTTGDSTSLGSTIDNFVDTAVASITGGAAGPSKCDSKKITLTGTEASNKAKCYAKAASSGKALVLTCLSKEETKLVSAFTKAELAGDCSALSNAGAIESQVTTFVGTAVNPLVP